MENSVLRWLIPAGAEKLNTWHFTKLVDRQRRFGLGRDEHRFMLAICAGCKKPLGVKRVPWIRAMTCECGLTFRRVPVLTDGFCDDVYAWRSE